MRCSCNFKPERPSFNKNESTPVRFISTKMSCFGNCLSSCRKKCPRGRQEGEGMQQPIAIGGHAHPFRYHERKRRGSTYECNACQQPGCGPYYSCTGGNGCNFHYHKRCSDILRRESPPVSNHPPYPIGRYIFDERAPGNVRYCVACGDPVRGLRYKVRRYPLQNSRAFHPLCAVLPPRIQEPREYQIVLELKERIRGECPICQGSARGWAYNSTCGTYCYHVGCVKNKTIQSRQQGDASDNEGNERGITVHVNIQLPPIERLARVAIRLIIGAIFGVPNVPDIFTVLFH